MFHILLWMHVFVVSILLMRVLIVPLLQRGLFGSVLLQIISEKILIVLLKHNNKKLKLKKVFSEKGKPFFNSQYSNNTLFWKYQLVNKIINYYYINIEELK